MRAKEIVGNIEGNLIGIHIRRTDHMRAIELSPTYLFFERIRNEIEADNSVKFLLSTDDIDTEEALKKEFAERIIYQKK